MRAQIVKSEQEVGLLLQGQRRTRKLTQRELGQAAGISQERMSVLELHPERLTLERLLRLMNALDLELVVRPKSAPAATGANKKVPEW